MYKLAIDAHTHSIYSGHALCTYERLLEEAAIAGLSGLGISDHVGRQFTKAEGGAITAEALSISYPHILVPQATPLVQAGVKKYHSMEIDIVKKDGSLFGYDIDNNFFDYNGTLDNMFLDKVDYAIASVHVMDEDPHLLTESQGTDMYINVMQKQKVFILGHVNRRDSVSFNVGEVVKAAKQLGKVLEINEAYCLKRYAQDMPEMCLVREIAMRCAEEGAMIAVSSDAHLFNEVGIFTDVLAILDEIGFPPDLIVNENMERFEKAIHY